MPESADPPATLQRKRRRYRPRTRVPEPIERFGFLKAMAHFEGALEECPRKECARRHQCCGGPRGGLRRHAGIPLCRSEAVVTRAALADQTGGPRQRKHGELWTAEQCNATKHGQPFQPTSSEEAKAPAVGPDGVATRLSARLDALLERELAKAPGK